MSFLLWRWIGSGLAIVGLVAAVGWWQHGPLDRLVAPQTALAQGVEPVDMFRLVWSQPVTSLSDTSLSSDGHFIVTVTPSGQIALWNWAQHPVHPLWTQKVKDTTQAIVSSGAPWVIAYSRLDPTRPSVVLLGQKGKVIGKSTLDGAVWSAAFSANGEDAGVTTGSDSLYLYSLEAHPTRRQVHLAGIGTSVALSPEGKEITVGTWNASGVDGFNNSGTQLWQYPMSSSQRDLLTDRIFKAQTDQSGQDVLGLSFTNVHDGDGIVYYWRAGNPQPLWQHAFGETAFDPQALISSDGRYVAVSYTRVVTHGENSVVERRLMVLNSQGTLLWDKGGLLFAPRLVSVAADGHRVTVSDGQNTLYHLDETGRITAPYHFRSRIKRTFSTKDGRWLLVYTSDGMLNLLRFD